MPTERVRLVQMVLTPTFVVDDGESLRPLSVQPITIPGGEWADVLGTVERGRLQLESELLASVEANGKVTT